MASRPRDVQLISAALSPGQFMLDIGCGTGYTACLLAKERGANVVAADISSKVLDWAKKRIAREEIRCSGEGH